MEQSEGTKPRWAICVSQFCPDSIDLERERFVHLVGIDEYAHKRCYDAAVKWFRGDERAAESYFARQLAKDAQSCEKPAMSPSKSPVSRRPFGGTCFNVACYPCRAAGRCRLEDGGS